MSERGSALLLTANAPFIYFFFVFFAAQKVNNFLFVSNRVSPSPGSVRVHRGSMDTHTHTHRETYMHIEPYAHDL